MGISSRFPLGSILVSWVWVPVRTLRVSHISEPRWIPSKKAYGELDTTPLLTSRRFLVRKDSLTLRIRKHVIFLSGKDSLSYYSPVIFILEYRSTETNSVALWDPFTSCFRFTMLCLNVVVQIYLLGFTDLSLSQWVDVSQF